MQINRNRQKGVTLIEVLVAVVVLSVGFLATSRMQIMGMRYNQSAFMKSQAGIIASSIADRMRTNVAGVNAGLYDSVNTTSLPGDPGCMTSGCNLIQLAQLDIRQWGLELNKNLPDGIGKVTNNNGLFQIDVQWSESIDDANQNQTVSIWLTP